MPITCHIVTSSNDPSRGGMEETVHRIATRLASQSDLAIIVYTSDPGLQNSQVSGYKTEDISAERHFLAMPLIESCHSRCVPFENRSPEGFQLTRLLLKARIESALSARPDDLHLLVSFFLTKFGFTAQLIAKELGLRHVACIAGSDLNRDIASPIGLAAAEFVMKYADWVVVRSREQAQRIGKLFNRSQGVSVYAGGLPDRQPQGFWNRNSAGPVRIVSDCGYSFKKSTHTLVEAFARLLDQNYPVALSIAGPTQKAEQTYWQEARSKWKSRFGDFVCFRDCLPKDDVECMLLHGDVYASASLGEGSPNGTLFALSLGMPVVAPRGSSVDDVSEEFADRVSLFQAGDRQELYECLAEMVTRIQSGVAPMDQRVIQAFRRRTADRELQHWLNVVHGGTGV